MAYIIRRTPTSSLPGIDANYRGCTDHTPFLITGFKEEGQQTNYPLSQARAIIVRRRWMISFCALSDSEKKKKKVQNRDTSPSSLLRRNFRTVHSIALSFYIVAVTTGRHDRRSRGSK